MNLKCRSFYGSSDTVCSLKVVYENRAHEFGGTQGETEKEQEFLSTIFAFITLETTIVRRIFLPGTDHLLSYEHPCDSKVASVHFTNYQISIFSSQNGDTKIFFAAPLRIIMNVCLEDGAIFLYAEYATYDSVQPKQLCG